MRTLAIIVIPRLGSGLQKEIVYSRIKPREQMWRFKTLEVIVIPRFGSESQKEVVQ